METKENSARFGQDIENIFGVTGALEFEGHLWANLGQRIR